MKRVIVVGGGLSGLAASRALLDEAGAQGFPLSVTLVEREPVVGGKIRSTREDGFLCEAGPPGFLDNKPSTLALARRLGIGDRLLKSNDAARKRFLFCGGRIQQLPEDPASFLLSDLLSIRGRLRIAADFFLPQGDPSEDESVASFVRRRLGDEALDKLIDPMSAGIYAGDPNGMSLKSCFPRVFQIEQQFGGLIKGMLAMQKMAKERGQQGPVGAGPGGALWSFTDGASELTASLASSLEGHRLLPGVGADALERVEGGWRVRAGGQTLEADAVVLAVPAYEAAALLSSFDEELGNQLYAIPYVPAAVVCIGYRKADIPHALDGFGFLIPRSEGRRILGSRWDSSTFAHRAPDGSALLTQIVGGARDPQLVGLADEELLQVVREELEAALGVRARPAYEKVVRWKRAIPQYLVGHGARVKNVEGRVGALGGVFLAGNAYYGIGINDCTAHAGVVAPRVLQALGAAGKAETPRGGRP